MTFEEMLKLRAGDKVKVTRKAQSHECDTEEREWVGFWAADMDHAVGRVHTVTLVPTGADGARLYNAKINCDRWYPWFVLEKVADAPAPDEEEEQEVIKMTDAEYRAHHGMKAWPCECPEGYEVVDFREQKEGDTILLIRGAAGIGVSGLQTVHPILRELEEPQASEASGYEDLAVEQRWDKMHTVHIPSLRNVYLATVASHQDFMGYVWEEGGNEMLCNSCRMWRSRSGVLLDHDAGDCTLEVCKAVRMKKGE